MKTITIFIILFIVAIAITWYSFISSVMRPSSFSILSPLSDSIKGVSRMFYPNGSSLDAVIDDILKEKSGKYAVVIKNMKTGETYTKNEHLQFESASLYKLWVMATAYDQINKGQLSKDDVLEESIPVLNEVFEIPVEDAELTDGEIQRTVSAAIEDMITISHNYAALLLAEKVKLSSVNMFLRENALYESKTGIPPVTSAYDTAMFFEKLYYGDIVNKKSSNEMIEVLKRQKLNNRIPKYLPNIIEVAHKTGEIGGYKHDAGIVYSPHADYIIVVLSQSDNPEGAAEIEAEISKAAYEYFNK